MKTQFILLLVLIITSCSQKDQPDSLVFQIENKQLQAGVMNYLDSVPKPGNVSSMLHIETCKYGDTVQYCMYYSTGALYGILANSLTIMVQIQDKKIPMSFIDYNSYFKQNKDALWPYLKDTFKKEYDYYQGNSKEEYVPNMHGSIPVWIYKFKNGELIDKEVDILCVPCYEMIYEK